jgi:hypothetical protein
MEAYALLMYVGLSLPFLLAAALQLLAPPGYRASVKLFVALLLLSHGSLGVWVALRTILNMMPIRPIAMVPQEYVVGMSNIESIAVLAASSVMTVAIARRVLFPAWPSVVSRCAKLSADEALRSATKERA